MICSGYNAHIIKLLMDQQILWKLKLKSGTDIWSDFDIENFDDPWTRAKEYCRINKENIITVEVIVPGQEPIEVFHDENGLDEIFISRGIAKNITDIDETAYTFMVFGQLKNNKLYIKKFFWPECEFLATEEIRELTDENKNLIYVKEKN